MEEWVDVGAIAIQFGPSPTEIVLIIFLLIVSITLMVSSSLLATNIFELSGEIVTPTGPCPTEIVVSILLVAVSIILIVLSSIVSYISF